MPPSVQMQPSFPNSLKKAEAVSLWKQCRLCIQAGCISVVTSCRYLSWMPRPTHSLHRNSLGLTKPGCVWLLLVTTVPYSPAQWQGPPPPSPPPQSGYGLLLLQHFHCGPYFVHILFFSYCCFFN